MTTKTIDEALRKTEAYIQAGHELDPVMWLQKAFELNGMLYSLNNEMFTLQHELAGLKARKYAEDKTSARIKDEIEADPRTLQVNLLQGKKKQVEELIRLAKKMAEAKRFEFDNQH